MTILRSFFYNSFVKFHGKKIGSHNMTMLYPIQSYHELPDLSLLCLQKCYKASL